MNWLRLLVIFIIYGPKVSAVSRDILRLTTKLPPLHAKIESSRLNDTLLGQTETRYIDLCKMRRRLELRVGHDPAA